MALVVEDGTGLENANGYISVADADTYHTDHSASSTWSSASTANKEKAIRLASQYLDAAYGRRWVGTRWSLDQALNWPRSYVVMYDIYVHSTAVLPDELKHATAEMALRQLSDGDLMPDITNPYNISEEEVQAGSVSSRTKYAGGGKSQIKRYRLVDNILRPLLRSGIERA
tara:strand:- start:960 stop:1472 length:513 start_codon:yes stop_codon:yes gene_type:complete